MPGLTFLRSFRPRVEYPEWKGRVLRGHGMIDSLSVPLNGQRGYCGWLSGLLVLFGCKGAVV
jgi:hypothetical protein